MTFSRIVRLSLLAFLCCRAATHVLAQTSMVVEWYSAIGSTPPAPVGEPDDEKRKIPSGTTYFPGAVAHGGPFNNVTDTLTVTKSGGTTAYNVTASGTFSAQIPSSATTSDTGNRYVSFTAYATCTRNNSTYSTVSMPAVKVKIYIPDTQAPSAPGNIRYTGRQSTQFTLVWDASTDNQLVEYYEISKNGVVIVSKLDAINHQPGTPFTYDVTGLSTGNTYNMSVRARDWAGNYSSPSAISVYIPVPDTTPPTAPGALSFTSTPSTASASWGASTDNVAISSYSVKLTQGSVSGTVVNTQNTQSTNCSFSGLTPNTTYWVSVTAVDTSNNTSTATTGQFTTQPLLTPGAINASDIKATSFSVSFDPFIVDPQTSYYLIKIGTTIYNAGLNTSYTFTGLTAGTTYTVSYSGVSTTNQQSVWSNALSVTTDVTPVSLSSVARPTSSTQIVGNPGGTVTVDNHGGANYSIPIQIAPGRSGMQPQISLNYSSGSGNGIAGVGFGLGTGFPRSITRGRSIYARDGVVQGITFSDSDKFYLDGKRLLCVSGSPGRSGSGYRTEVDSFAVINAYGAGTGIDRFEVVEKNGTKLTFGKLGTSTDAFQKGGGEPGDVAFAYALKEVMDPLGNTITFNYTPLGGGEYVLSTIDYTGGIATADAQVEFLYEARPDQPVTYLANRAFNHRARLALINAKSRVSGTLQRTAAYSLDYNSDTSAGRSRLTTITPFYADPNDPAFALQKTAPWQIAWQNETSQMASTAAWTYNTYPNSVIFADTDGDGKDDAIPSTDGGTWVKKVGDFDGNGTKDVLTLSFSQGAIVSLSIPNMDVSAVALGTYFSDPGHSGLDLQLRQMEGLGIASRIVIGDFNGDGCDDLAVHGFDGKLHVHLSTRTGFAASVEDSNHAPFVYGNVSTSWEIYWASGNGSWDVNKNIDDHFFVNPMPCDLNGDGRMDYVMVDHNQYLSGPINTGSVTGVTTIRHMVGVLSLPDGTFGPTFTIGGAAMMVPTQTNNGGSIRLNDVNCGALAGDFNGDGLTDFLVLVPDFEMQPGLTANVYGGCRWSLYLNQGDTAGHTEAFVQYNGPIPNTIALTSGEVVNTYYTPSQSTVNGNSIYPIPYYNTPAHEGKNYYCGFEGAGGTVNNLIMDVNHDGLADLVWYVGYKSDESAVSATSAGWYAMVSTGNFANGVGFTGPIKLDHFSPNASGGTRNTPAGSAPSAFSSTIVSRDLDYNGDGQPDYLIQGASNGSANGTATVYLANGATGSPFNDLAQTITDPIGRVTSVAYKAAKDNTVYTGGAAVSYPIRELRSSSPVVSDVWQDGGTGTASDRAQFSYQYSGNRLDLSGRGGLGFHSFVTLDRQTNVFRYQFLAQSFPMTGLTHREQTYRAMGSGKFRCISSHDNTVVFDAVTDDSGGTIYGSLFPFISKAVESRWEDDLTTEHFTITGAGTNPVSENVFTSFGGITETPYITITSTSKFDSQSTVQTSLVSGYNPSDFDAVANANKVSSTVDPSIFNTLPKVKYGNLTELYTDYGDSSAYTEKVTTTYKTGQTLWNVTTLTGLVDKVTTEVTALGISGTEKAPDKVYTYKDKTTLVETETVDVTNSALDYKTTFSYDSRGRLTQKKVEGTDLLSKGQGASTLYVYNVASTDFDDRFDLPKVVTDAYGHGTTTAYHAFLGKAVSVTDVNSAQTTMKYDALGRTIQMVDVSKGITQTTSYVADTSESVSCPSGITGLLSLSSAYRVQVDTTARPSISTYYDRIGRTLRTKKDNFTGTTITDSIYNALGQVVGVSNPYPSGGTRLWTVTDYDLLGRARKVISPNGTTTETTYKGRTTIVSVDAPSISGVDPDAQITTTVVNAKGQVVRVWNADHVPTTIDTKGVATGTNADPSVSFTLDGFGRMRSTALRGGGAITAEYDDLGRQRTLIDPDKGTWTYVNSSLGFLLEQKDANLTTTTTQYDPFGHPLARTIQQSGGPSESTNWYYYDGTTGDDGIKHTVALGNKGWTGALQREETSTSGASGYTGSNSASKNVHYYDTKGRPSVDMALIDGKWFYTYTDYDDAKNLVKNVRHYWRPPGQEATNTSAYVWKDFGYTYTYDGKGYMTSVTDSLGRTWWSVASDGYDYMDRPVKVQKGSSLWTQRVYRDSDNTLSAIKTGLTVGSSTVQNLTFTFDGLGNLQQRTGAGGTEDLLYDPLNRLKQSKQGVVSYEDNGNIKNKKDVDGSTSPDFAYGDSAHIHAVTSAFGNSYGYDANGNLSTRSNSAKNETWSFSYAGFDKPRWMAKTTNGTTTVGSEFLYNGNHSRTVQLEFDQMASGAPSHYIRKRVYGLGPILEANYENGVAAGSPADWKLKKIRIYIPGPDGIIGSREFDPQLPVGSQEKAYVYHYDHLGSIECITPFGSADTSLANDSSGKSGRFSEDAWGRRRDPGSWVNKPTSTDDGGADSLSPRGFTGHEMLDGLDLVHMNGRIYDPLVGRFLSADIAIQNPRNLQSYNRYSYVMNNPLTLTDPSGFYFLKDDPWHTFYHVGSGQGAEVSRIRVPEAGTGVVHLSSTQLQQIGRDIQKIAQEDHLAPETQVIVPIQRDGVIVGYVRGTVGEAASLVSSAAAATAGKDPKWFHYTGVFAANLAVGLWVGDHQQDVGRQIAIEQLIDFWGLKHTPMLERVIAGSNALALTGQMAIVAGGAANLGQGRSIVSSPPPGADPRVFYTRVQYGPVMARELLEYHRLPGGGIMDPSGRMFKAETYGTYWEIGHAGLPYSQRVLEAARLNMSYEEWYKAETDFRFLRPEMIYTNRSNLFQDAPTPSAREIH